MHEHAGVMELVDVLDSKSSAARRAGSSPATGTRNESVLDECSRFFYAYQNGLLAGWMFSLIIQIIPIIIRSRKEVGKL